MTEPRPVQPPPTLFWLYGLVAAGLFSIGVAAGNLFFVGNRSLVLPFHVELAQCERAHPDWATDASALTGLTECMQGPGAVWGRVVLAGAALVLAGALALMVVLPLVDRWRSKWRRNRLRIPGAQQRFDTLCDHSGLFGRRRPGLFVARPPVRQAFTTALPGRRPIVVLPAAVALSYADSRRFDPIVRHELAHVLARDVSWVSALRGLLWIAVPAVVIGASPDLLAVEAVNALPATVFVEATVLVAAVAALAAGLLRRREHEADQYAASAGSASALAELLAGAAARPRRRNVLRRMLASHPDPAARISALRRSGVNRSARGDLAQAAAFGFVTVTVMGATYSLTALLDYANQDWLAPVVACAAGGLLLGVGLTPSLYRRAVAARRAGQTVTWGRPLLGMAVGVVAGMFVSPVVSMPGRTPFNLPTGNVATTVLSVALIAAVGTGAVAVCAGLAVLMSAGRASRTLRSMTYVAGGLAAFAAFWPLTYVSSTMSAPGLLRSWLVYELPAKRWPLFFAAVPLAAVILLSRRRPGPGVPGQPAGATIHAATVRAAIVGAVAFVLASFASVLRSHVVSPNTTELALQMRQERAWISALAGLVVLLIVVGRGGARSVPLAIVVSCSVTVASGAVQFVDGALTVRSWSQIDLRLSVATPGVWLAYLIVLAAPVLVLLGRTTPAAALNAAPDSATPDSATAGSATPDFATPDPVAHPTAGRLRTVGTAGLAAAATAGVAGLIVGVGLPLGFVSPRSSTIAAPPAPAATESIPPTTGATPVSPDRILSDDEAHTVAASVQAVLPAYWKLKAPSTTTSNDSPAEPASCLPIATDAYIKALEPHQRATGSAEFETVSALSSVASSTLFVTVYAYDEPVPRSLFTAADAALAACPRLSETTQTGVLTVDFEGRPTPTFGDQAWRVIHHLSLRYAGTRLTGTSSYTIVSVGNHLITVLDAAVLERLDETIADRALTAALATLRTMVGSR